MSVDSLREEVRGEVFVDGDEGYEEARSVYNGMIDAAALRATAESLGKNGYGEYLMRVLDETTLR